MKKTLLTVMTAMALTGAQAQVAINATNFPDKNFRAQVKEFMERAGDRLKIGYAKADVAPCAILHKDVLRIVYAYGVTLYQLRKRIQ